MNAQFRPVEIIPQVVPMTVTALRMLDDNGFFEGDCNKHELIDGVLVMTPPPGVGHNFVELRANRALSKMIFNSEFADTHAVQTGGSFQIGEEALLGPDLMIVSIPSEPTPPTADTIVALIEIAWSSRANDLGPKALMYAQADILDYWVLDVAAKTVIVHRDPVDGVYTSVRSFSGASEVTCLKLPDLSVSVAELF